MLHPPKNKRPGVVPTLALVILVFGLGLPFVRAAEKSSARPERKPIKTHQHKQPNAQSVAFSPDGKFVAAAFGGPSNGRFPLKATSGGVAVWNAETGKHVQFVGEYGDVVSLDFTADRKSLIYGRLYTPGDSVNFDTIALVDIAEGKTFRPEGRFRRRHVSAASPKQDQLFLEGRRKIGTILSQDQLKTGDVEGTPLKVENSRSSRCAAFASDGKSLAVVHHRIEPIPKRNEKRRSNRNRIRCQCLTVFAADSLKPLCRIVSNKLTDCYAVTIAVGGEWIATGHRKGVVRLWNSRDESFSKTLNVPATGYARPLFSPDGRELAVLVQSSISRTWKYADTPSGFQYGQAVNGHQAEVVFFETDDFSPIRHWQFADGSFRTWHANRPEASLNPARIAFSPDGKQLLIGAGGVSLIEIATGKVIRQFDVP